MRVLPCLHTLPVGKKTMCLDCSQHHSVLGAPVQARVLRRHMWWQNARMAVVISALVLLAAYAIVCVVCSPTFKC